MTKNRNSCQHRSTDYWDGDTFEKKTSTSSGIDPVSKVPDYNLIKIVIKPKQVHS